MYTKFQQYAVDDRRLSVSLDLNEWAEIRKNFYLTVKKNFLTRQCHKMNLRRGEKILEGVFTDLKMCYILAQNCGRRTESEYHITD
jgi:hypothetical protein